MRGMRWKDVLTYHPTRRMLCDWHKDAFKEDQPNDYRSFLLKLPQGYLASSDEAKNVGERKRVRPERFDAKFNCLDLVHGLNFVNYLRDTGNFVESLQAALDYLLQRKITSANHDLLANDHPSRWTLMRAFKRIDYVSMLLDRREFTALFHFPDRILGLHLYSDGSCTRGRQSTPL